MRSQTLQIKRITLIFALIIVSTRAYLSSAEPISPKHQADINSSERVVLLAALKPPKRKRPLVAVVGSNEGTETTDFLIPYGVLKRSGVVDVVALGTTAGAIKMMPALSIEPDASIREFDAQHPEGADYVIVPAMHNSNDVQTVAWIKRQATEGAIIVGICAGAKVLGNAGLLDDRLATTHWYDLADLRKTHPTVQYVPDRRYLVDRGVATTTGVSASIPISLTLVEAIAGTDRAAKLAAELGVDSWDAQHDSSEFRATWAFYRTAIFNTLAFWRHEKLEISIAPGVDEIALALTADAWSRTYRSRALTVSANEGDVKTRGGIRIIPDRHGSKGNSRKRLASLPKRYPAMTLDTSLNEIADRYGHKTAQFVALQLEHPQELDSE